MKGELGIRDIIEVNNILLQCREQPDGTCLGCFFLVTEEHVCDHIHQPCGCCSSVTRTDNKDVIFVKVGEVQDA